MVDESGSDKKTSDGKNNSGSGKNSIEINNDKISIETFQDIYRKVTGREKNFSKSYSNNIFLELSDIENLYFRIQQVCRQYSIVGASFRAIAGYDNDSSENFISFEDLKLRCGGASNAIESISLRFSFMIRLPLTGEMEHYAVNAIFFSRITIRSRVKTNALRTSSDIFRFFGGRTAGLDINYIDYAVARTITAAFDEWIKLIHGDKNSKILEFSQKNSYWIPRIARLFTVSVGFYVIFLESSNFISTDTPNLLQFSRFIVCCSGLLLTAYCCAAWSAELLEDAIDSLYQISYIKLSKGDEIAIRKSTGENRFLKIKGFILFLFTFLISVLTKTTSGFLLKLILS